MILHEYVVTTGVEVQAGCFDRPIPVIRFRCKWIIWMFVMILLICGMGQANKKTTPSPEVDSSEEVVVRDYECDICMVDLNASVASIAYYQGCPNVREFIKDEGKCVFQEKTDMVCGSPTWATKTLFLRAGDYVNMGGVIHGRRCKELCVEYGMSLGTFVCSGVIFHNDICKLVFVKSPGGRVEPYAVNVLTCVKKLSASAMALISDEVLSAIVLWSDASRLLMPAMKSSHDCFEAGSLTVSGALCSTTLVIIAVEEDGVMRDRMRVIVAFVFNGGVKFGDCIRRSRGDYLLIRGIGGVRFGDDEAISGVKVSELSLVYYANGSRYTCVILKGSHGAILVECLGICSYASVIMRFEHVNVENRVGFEYSPTCVAGWFGNE